MAHEPGRCTRSDRRSCSRTSRSESGRPTVAPGESLPIHFHDLDYVTVTLTEGDVEVYEADGTVRRGHRVPGDVQVTKVGSGQTHVLKNVGTAPYVNRIIELKQHGLSEGTPENIALPSPT